MLHALACFALAAGLVPAAESAEGHSFEWAGVFEVPETTYTWTSQKVGGKYADASMKLVAMPVANANKETLHQVEESGETALSSSCSDVQHGGTVTASGTCFNLVFDPTLWQSLFFIDASNTAAIAFFTEHVPTEFEATAHYLKDEHGDDIEPAAELPEESDTEDSHDGKPWGQVILAAIIINLVTLVGVFLAIPAIKKAQEANALAFTSILAGFAAGCILATAVFLLMFEATHLVATGWREEVAVLWRWGTCILAGFALPSIADSIAHAASAGVPEQTEVKSVVVGDLKDAEEKPQEPSLSTKVRMLVAVLIGDFFHNLCDGIFVGAAFMGCGDSFGWTVLGATVLHELPQELADYTILTGPGLALRPAIALLLNFISGTSVLLGAIIVLGSDVSDASVGLLLAFGAGVYLHISAVECMPKIFDDRLSAWIRGACISAFLFGTILIGLILLDHEHCVPSGDAAAGGGHH